MVEKVVKKKVSLSNRLSYYNPRSSHKYYFNKDGTPKTVIRAGGSSRSLMTSSERTVKNLKLYYQYYHGEGTVWAAINSIAFNTIMTGYHIVSNDENAKKLIEDFCFNINLDSNLLNATIYALVMGDSFLEIIYKKDKVNIARIKQIDPKTMIINFDDFGDVQSYQQTIGGTKRDPIDPEYICHINLFPRPDSPYGISLIEPSRDTIKRKIRTDQALASAIIRHGTSKYVATIGTEKEKQSPPPKVLDKIKKDLEDISEKQEFVIPWNCKIETIDEKGIQGVEEYFNYFQAQAVVGLLCPEEALGLGKGSTEATARIKAIMYERMIQSFQLRISRIIEQELFNKVLEANNIDINTVKIKFNSVTDEDEAMKAKWMGNILHGFRGTAIKPFTINEIRAYFGKEPVDESWANSLKYDLTADEDEKEKPKKKDKKK